MTKLKLVFAPGCFDDFDGTQEELDEFMTMIESKFNDGSLLDESMPLDEADLDDDQLAHLQAMMNNQHRNLQ